LRAFAHPTNVIQFHRDLLLAGAQQPSRLKGKSEQVMAIEIK
jgi:hypothetical protein